MIDGVIGGMRNTAGRAGLSSIRARTGASAMVDPDPAESCWIGWIRNEDRSITDILAFGVLFWPASHPFRLFERAADVRFRAHLCRRGAPAFSA